MPLALDTSAMVMRCRGRPPMTLSQTDRGLVTISLANSKLTFNYLRDCSGLR